MIGNNAGVSQRNNFDRSKPFYPYVMSFLVHLHGLKELAIIGLAGPRPLPEIIRGGLSYSGVDLSKINQDRICSEVTDLEKNLSKIAGPLELRTRRSGRIIEISSDFIGKELIQNHHYLFEHAAIAAMGLLMLCFESMRANFRRNKHPYLEFLYHCRNAAAHNGRFRFNSGEPKYRAEWSGFEIVRCMEGERLLRANDTGLLMFGDAIELLWDIEQECIGRN